LYFAEQSGRVIRFVTSGAALGKKRTVLDITKFTSANGEQGLLGIAFNPNGKFLYVNYTDTGGDTVVARYAVNSAGVAALNTRTVLFTLEQPYTNHNGGGLAFGPEGRLYIGTGDGGSGGDPKRVALKKSSRLGKILSINPDAPSQEKNDLTIWSRGLRNPWRFEFDPSGNLWIADVGQNTWEEVNVAWASSGAGKNVSFGWSAFEGKVRYNADQPATRHQLPAYVYQHGNAGCSISGGTRIRDPKIPSFKNWYVFGDYCSGRITAIFVQGNRTTASKILAKNVGAISAVKSSVDGTVYVLTLGGKVFALRAN